MPSPSKLKFDPITTDWTYIRWLGDRKTIEDQTMTWGKTVVDRTEELHSWVDFCYQMRKRGVLVCANANNHHSGHTPATIEQFRDLWRPRGLPEIGKPIPQRRGSLFSLLCMTAPLSELLASLPIMPAAFFEPIRHSKFVGAREDNQARKVVKE
jgi:hypothetical protein